MKRIEIVIYTVDDDVDNDVDKVVAFARGSLAPELVIVGKNDITPELLANVLRQSDDLAL